MAEFSLSARVLKHLRDVANYIDYEAKALACALGTIDQGEAAVHAATIRQLAYEVNVWLDPDGQVCPRINRQDGRLIVPTATTASEGVA